MPNIPRSEILERLRLKRSKGLSITGGGAGTGLSAKCEEAGGVDLIVIYNSGRFRMAGRGSLSGLLAYGNANDMVIDMGSEVLPMVKDVPVLAGVNGTDPFYNPDHMISKLKAMGFSGIQNFPTVGLIDGVFRQHLEETGMGFNLEVDLVRRAHDQDFFTSPYVFSAEDATAMAEAGADVIVCHFGLTAGGAVGAQTSRSLDECAGLASEWAEAARRVRDDVIVLIHGGPVAEPADVEVVLRKSTGLDGFYGASSMERLPTEVAVTKRVQEFSTLRTEP